MVEENAIGELAGNKSAGVDYITAKVFKAMGPTGKKMSTTSASIIIPFHKKNPANRCENYLNSAYHTRQQDLAGCYIHSQLQSFTKR